MSAHTHDSQHNHCTEHNCGEHHHDGHHHDHHHDHEHQCCDADCGCGHHHHPVELSQPARDFLSVLGRYSYLPLAQFLMTSTKSSHLQSIALSPVYLTCGTESVPKVREVGEMLLDLEEMGLITLDFDQPLQNYDYEVYLQSASFHALEDAIKESRQREGFLFDGASLEKGSIAMTTQGQQVFGQFNHTHHAHHQQD